MHCFRNFAFNVYKKNDLKKAIMYRVYYSRYGEDLIRLLSPIKGFLFSMIEKKGKGTGTETVEASKSDAGVMRGESIKVTGIDKATGLRVHSAGNYRPGCVPL